MNKTYIGISGPARAGKNLFADIAIDILKNKGIDEKTIFYGVEDIITDNVLWKIFSTIKKLSPSFVQFYDLPLDKVHGVVTRIEM